jgi:Transposase
MLFAGVDWGEAHHDLCLLDQDGSVLAARRIADGLAGVGELHALVAAHSEHPAQVVVGIETDRGLLVGALLAAGYQVYAVNPQVVGRYRGRHQVSRAKSDSEDVSGEDVRRGHQDGLTRSPTDHWVSCLGSVGHAGWSRRARIDQAP